MGLVDKYKKPLIYFGAFLVFTLLIKFVDVRQIGPKATSVGFGLINGFFHNLLGFNTFLYKISSILGYIALLPVALFTYIGAVQLMQRKDLMKVDRDILILGGFYIVVFALYILFDHIPINYRPVLIDGEIELSYPSSHTLMSICVMMTTWYELNWRLKNSSMKKGILVACLVLMVLVVLTRFLSGVHWFTDIIGSIILSASLVSAFEVLTRDTKIRNRKKRKKAVN